MKPTYLDPLVLAKISSMSLRAKRIVEGSIAGLHESPYKGWSQEFAQHREYAFGDEPKHIDWKIYGRSDRYFVKQYEEETNLRAYIMLDCSASMNYHSKGRVTKLQYASYLVAALAYLMLKQQDAVGLATFSTRIDRYLPPRNHLKYLSIIFNQLEKISSGGETKISTVLQQFGQYLKRRGLVILVSDLFDEPEDIIRSLQYFCFKKHEVVVFQILDPLERNLPEGDSILFEHLETMDKVSTEPEIIRDEYQKIVAEFISKYKIKFRDRGIDYYLFNTNTPLDYALCEYMANRDRT